MTEEKKKNPRYIEIAERYESMLKKLAEIHETLCNMAEDEADNLTYDDIYNVVDQIEQIMGKLLTNIYLHGYLTIDKE